MGRVNGAVFLLLLLLSAGDAGAAPPPELERFSFLLGEWSATGAGSPGAGTGVATFSRGLQDRVIVRTSYAEYPASGTRPASRHDDLLIAYVAASGGVRADYYDSEGHVIRYAVESPAPGEAVLLSDVVTGEPRYRLRYTLHPDGLLEGEFAIAPPGKPEAFAPYLRWQSRKSSRSGTTGP